MRVRVLGWGIQPGRPGQSLRPRAGHAPVIHMLAVGAEAARVVIVPLTLGQLFVLLFIGCGNHMEPNDGCPHGLAKHMLCLFKSSISKVAIINPDNAIILMKKVFLFSFTTFLQSFY